MKWKGKTNEFLTINKNKMKKKKKKNQLMPRQWSSRNIPKDATLWKHYFMETPLMETPFHEKQKKNKRDKYY